jgi:hypothetical protein
MIKNNIFVDANLGKQYIEVVCLEGYSLDEVKLKLFQKVPNLTIASESTDRIYIKLDSDGLGISGKELEQLLAPEAYYQHFTIEIYRKRLCKVFEKFDYRCLPMLDYIYENGKPIAAYMPT